MGKFEMERNIILKGGMDSK